MRYLVILAVMVLGLRSAAAQERIADLQEKVAEQERKITELEEQKIELKAQLQKVRQENKNFLAGRFPPPPKPKPIPKPEPKPIKTPEIEDKFYLKDRKTGKLHGPYEAAKGAHMRIGSSSFTYVKKKLSPVEKKLVRVTIPQVDFRQANIHDIISYLQSAIPEFSKGRARVHFVRTPPPKGYEYDLITLQMRKANVLEMLKSMAAVAHLEYKFSENTVTISLLKNEETRVTERAATTMDLGDPFAQPPRKK